MKVSFPLKSTAQSSYYSSFVMFILFSLLTSVVLVLSVKTFYRAMFRYLLHNAHVDKHDQHVEKEVAAALETVFPQSSLTSFEPLSNSDKLVYLRSLSDIVLGIRLFNQELSKGGAGIPNCKDFATKNTHNNKPQF